MAALTSVLTVQISITRIIHKKTHPFLITLVNKRTLDNNSYLSCYGVISACAYQPGSTVCHTNVSMTHVLRVDAEPRNWEDRLRAMLISSSEKVDTKCRSCGRSSIKYCLTTTSFADYGWGASWDVWNRIQHYFESMHDRIIQDQLQKSIVEDVPETKTSSVCPHYLPHHAIIRHNKDTSKLRMVYDASTTAPPLTIASK